MKYLKRFNESIGIAEYKELDFDESMMYSTLSFFSSLPRHTIPFNINDSLERLYNVIKDTLNDDIYYKFFPKEFYNKIEHNISIPLDFATSCITNKDLSRMFENVAICEGSDMEDQYVSALEINNTIVLLLHSPERGSQIRIQDSNITINRLEGIVKCICEIYNYLY